MGGQVECLFFGRIGGRCKCESDTVTSGLYGRKTSKGLLSCSLRAVGRVLHVLVVRAEFMRDETAGPLALAGLLPPGPRADALDRPDSGTRSLLLLILANAI